MFLFHPFFLIFFFKLNFEYIFLNVLFSSFKKKNICEDFLLSIYLFFNVNYKKKKKVCK
jgi:hypothetical protein